MKVKDVEKKYKNEWVLVEILKEDELGQPIDVKLLAHSKNRDDVYTRLKETKSKYVSTFYTGKIPQKGYAVALDSLSFFRNFRFCLDLRKGILEID